MSTCLPDSSRSTAIVGGEQLSVLVPCHNETDTVVELLTRVRASLPYAEIIVIDDGSTDGSVAEINHVENELNLVVLSNRARAGKGAAVRAGLTRVTRYWVVIQDADLEYDPADLVRLEQASVANPGCAVYGSRYFNQGKAAGGALAPFLGIKLLAVFAKLLYGRYLTDPHTCYKMLPAELMRSLVLESTGFELCAEITGKLFRQQVPIIEIPISYQPRSVAQGKKIRTRDFFKAIGMYWRSRFHVPPPRYSGEGLGEGTTEVMAMSFSSIIYILTRFLIGALLVVAGAMKLAPWREMPLTHWLVLPAAAVFAIGLAEFVLGSLVLSFKPWRFIQRICLAVFAIYVGVLLLQLSAGEVACQCLGSRSLPLLWMIGLDSLLLVAIWGLGEQWRAAAPRMNLGFLGEVLSSTRYALPVLVVAGTAVFGSLDAAIGYATGSRLLAVNSSEYVGQLVPGEIGTGYFELTNYGGQSIQILGAKPTCKCLAFDDLPLTLAPGASGQISLRLKAAESERALLQREGATLILDDPTRLLTLSVTATVVQSP